MNCPRCHTLNPDAARFCQNCGSPLTAACPHCGASLAVGAKFCHNCGQPVAPQGVSQSGPLVPQAYAAKLEAARASRTMEGERRIVTILFCDVKGSTTMAGQLDPEEWAGIMNDAFEHLIQPVYRYEGTVARLMGDAILAFFGAPIAHEDDPQRAILAGLEIVASLRDYRERLSRERGLDFNVRVGINTGLVVVGEMGSDLRLEYTAMGDAVNVAARMEQTAEPGSVQIAGNTYKLVAPLFDVDDLGGIEVKGKSERVPAYRVLRPRVQPGRLRGIEGLASPLVGRGSEMQTLQRLASQLRAGRGQIVSIMGEAGLGKSRLVAEWRQWLDASGDSPSGTPLWCEGRSFSYERSTPYAPFVDWFTRWLDLRAEQAPHEKYERLTARISDAFSEQAGDPAPYIATLLGLQPAGEDAERVKYLEPPQLRGRVFNAVSEFVERLAGRQPLVLAFEDLHWADATSLDLVEHLMPLTGRVPLMMVAIFRPQRHEPIWRFHEKAARDFAEWYTAIGLEPLDDNHARELVAHLLEIEDLPEKVRALILTKAEGNPFFVEEVIRSLLDARLVVRVDGHWRATREIANIAVPDTLAGVITARLDRLDDDAKRTAQTAAVIGREFSFATLKEVVDAPVKLDPALDVLQQRELIREKLRHPQPIYLFKHALTQETAYASLLLSRRRGLHRRVAECLERDAPENVNDMARHFLEAQEPARALPYLVEAGSRAARAYSTPEAIGYFTRAIECLQAAEDLSLARRAYEGLGGAHSLVNDFPHAVETFRAMLAYAQTHGDVPMQVSALNKLGYAVLWLGQFEEVERCFGEVERLANAAGDQAGLSEMCMYRCAMCTMAADFDRAVSYLSQAVRLGDELQHKGQRAFGLTHVANTLTYMMRFDEAWAKAQEAHALSVEIDDRQHIAETLAFPIAMHHLRNGQLDAAREAAEEGAQIGSFIGAALAECVGCWMSGEIARTRGEYERAIECYQRAQLAGRATGFPFMEAIALGALGTAYHSLGDAFLDRVADCHARALELLEAPGSASGAGIAWVDLGFCLLAKGELERAEDLFQKGLNVPTTQGLLNRPMFLAGSALVALARQTPQKAATYIAEARTLVDERAMKHLYPLIAFVEALVSAAQSDAERAARQFAQAEALALEMRMRPLVWQTRAGAAKALAALGRAAEAEAKRREARVMVDEIAGLFADTKFRASFVEGALRKIG